MTDGMTVQTHNRSGRAGAMILFTVAALMLTVIPAGMLFIPRGTVNVYLFAAAAGCVFALAMLLGNFFLQRTLPDGAGHKAARAVYLVLFAVYLAALAYMLFLMPVARDGMTVEAYFDYGKLNLTPFATVRRYIGAIRRGVIPVTSALNLAGNLLLFLPMGIFLALAKRPFSRAWCALTLMLLLIAAVEMLQLFFRIGSCDIDDLILNFTGGAAGFLLTLPRRIRGLLKEQRFIREA